MAAMKTVSSSEVELLENSETFSNVPLDVDQEKGKKKKVPRRIIHFSDGILEEYSTDEEEQQLPPPPQVDPKTLGWLSWFWHYTGTAACKALSGADFLGEKLAWFFGITSPKYQFALDEHYRLQEELEEEKKRGEREEVARQARENQKISELEGGPGEKGDSPIPTLTGEEGYDNLAMKY